MPKVLSFQDSRCCPKILDYTLALFKNAYDGAMQNKMEAARDLQALLTSLYDFKKFSAVT